MRNDVMYPRPQPNYYADTSPPQDASCGPYTPADESPPPPQAPPPAPADWSQAQRLRLSGPDAGRAVALGTEKVAARRAALATTAAVGSRVERPRLSPEMHDTISALTVDARRERDCHRSSRSFPAPFPLLPAPPIFSRLIPLRTPLCILTRKGARSRAQRRRTASPTRWPAAWVTGRSRGLATTPRGAWGRAGQRGTATSSCASCPAIRRGPAAADTPLEVTCRVPVGKERD